jgi:hypothetical protein
MVDNLHAVRVHQQHVVVHEADAGEGCRLDVLDRRAYGIVESSVDQRLLELRKEVE